MPLEARDKFGPYEIAALLGKGVVREVYRAKETKSDSALAIEAFLTAVAEDTDHTARFERQR